MKINYCSLIGCQIDPELCAYETENKRKVLCNHPKAESRLCQIAEPGPMHSLEFMKELDHDEISSFSGTKYRR